MTPDQIEALERIADRGWPARERASLGRWILNAADGWSGRLNACWPLGPEPEDLPAAIDAVEAWYADRGLPPLFKPAIETPGLMAQWIARGYAPRTETLMMTAAIPPVAASARVTVLDEADAAFETVFVGTQAEPADAAERIEAFRRLPSPRLFARIMGPDGPAAIGAAVVEGDWVGIFGMRTLAGQRRQGLARDIVAALLSGARAHGARRAYLQVEAGNGPAIALYEGFGFSVAYAYRYWARGASAA